MASRRCALVCALVALLVDQQVAHARGGGGCLVEGTLVLTPDGLVAIESIKPGDPVLSPDGAPLRVLDVIEVHTETAWELAPQLLTTGEHPFLVAPGVYRLARDLGKPVTGLFRAWNLVVEPPGTYVAAGRATHNKGCFLPDTLVTMEDGSAHAIATLAPGDRVRAWSITDGAQVATVIARHEYEVDSWLEVVTSRSTVRVTRDHLFAAPGHTLRTASSLALGERVLVASESRLEEAEVLDVRVVEGKTRVYNLLTDLPQTYFAAAHLVHNKGCFMPDTPVLREDGGAIPIDTVQPGDRLRAFTIDGDAVIATVERVYTVEAASIFEVETERGRIVRATAEHPFYAGDGVFRTVESLLPGDRVYTFYDGLVPDLVRAIRRVAGPVQVWNLATDAPNTFIAGGLAVHNKGFGCFPAGTTIATPGGTARAIETLAPGDAILSGDGRTVTVRMVAVQRDDVVAVATSAGELRTTRDHPLLTARGRFREVAALRRGANLRLGSGAATRVLGVRETGENELVYTLEVDEPHTFLANGFVAHNKGGGFRSGTGKGDMPFWLWAIMLPVAMVVLWFSDRGKATGELDFCHLRAEIEKKASKTRRIIERIAAQDKDFDPAELLKLARRAFTTLQEVWEKRDYTAMASFVYPDLRQQHKAQILSMIRNHEINRIANLSVALCEIVHLRYTERKHERQFTVLIEAVARDYYVNDATEEFLRGDHEPAFFQEFWTFGLKDGQWLLREIEQTQEATALADENFVEFLTPEGLMGAYGDDAQSRGPAGPEVKKPALSKETKIHRLLNFLYDTDKIWDRQVMEDTARSAAIEVYTTLEFGETTRLDTLATADFVAALKGKIASQIERGENVAFRNLCVRKVSFVLVRNRVGARGDEFVASVTLHARRTRTRGGDNVHQDADVTRFSALFRFQRQDGRFLLASIIPAAEAAGLVAAENVDEDSSPEQLQWYYSKERPGT